MAFKYGPTKKLVERPVLDGIELALLIEHLTVSGFEDQYKNIYLIKGKIKPTKDMPTLPGEIMRKLKVCKARIDAAEGK